MDPGSGQMFGDDPVCNHFLTDDTAMSMVENTRTPGDVSATEYDAIFFPGGFGAMFDMPDNAEINTLTASIYEAGGVVAGVGNGVVSLVNVKLSSGEYMVAGKSVTAFTNTQLETIQLVDYMPFLLETKLTENGGRFVDGGDWSANVVTDGRLVTGQNPQSASGVAEEIMKLLNN